MLAQSRQRLSILISLLLTIWVVQLYNHFTGYSLVQFGVIPRDTAHWYHIFFAPFIHGSFVHIIGNTPVLLLLGWLCLLNNRPFFFLGSLFIIIVGLLNYVFLLISWAGVPSWQ